MLIAKIQSLTKELKRRKHSAQQYISKESNNNGNYYSPHAFDYYKCIFIHIPKAAGISVAKSLFGNLAAGHKNYRYFQSKYPRYTLKQYYKFTFVRHPYTRISSAYSFLQNGGINERDLEFKNKVLSQYSSVNDFVLNYLNKQTIYSYTHFVPQVDYLINQKGKIDMDFIGKFESIDDDYKTITKKLGIKNTLNHYNKTKQTKKPTLNEEAKNKIYQLYQSDFKLLDYLP